LCRTALVTLPSGTALLRSTWTWCLCDRHTLRPQLAIELDDRSHHRPDRVARDVLVNEVFAVAQLPLLHVPVQRSYNPQHLVDVIDQALPRAA
jgi:hypothetical protein